MHKINYDSSHELILTYMEAKNIIFSPVLVCVELNDSIALSIMFNDCCLRKEI